MNMFNTIVTLLISFLVILTPISVILGIVLLVVRGNEQDTARKNKFKTAATWCIAGPFVLLFLLLSIWGLISVATHSGLAVPIKN